MADFDMTTLGQTQPTTSSAVQPSESPLGALLGNAIPRQEGAIQQLTQQMGAVQGQQAPSVLDQLLTPKGIGLILAIAGGAFGGGGLPVALGGGAGVLAGAQGNQVEFGKQQAAQMEQLRKQRDQADEQLDKTRNRITQLLQAQPELFTQLNPATGEPEPVAPPEVIGYYATGTNLSINPVSKMVMNRRKERFDQLIKLSTDALDKAGSREDARVITKQIFDLLDYPNAPDSTVEALVNTYGTPEFESELARTYLTEFGSTGISAIAYAGENDLTLHDPKVVRMLKPKPDLSKDPSASELLTAQFIFASRAIRDWSKAHPDEEMQVRQATSGDNVMYLTTLAGLALDQEQLGAYTTKIKKDPQTLVEYLAQLKNVDNEYSLVELLQTTGKLKATQGMTPGQIEQQKAESAVERVKANRENASQTAAVRDLQEANAMQRRFQDLNLSDEQIRGIIVEIRNLALKESTQPDGSVNLDTYRAVIRRESATVVSEYSQTGAK